MHGGPHARHFAALDVAHTLLTMLSRVNPYVAVVDDEKDLVWTTVKRIQQLRPQLEVIGFVDSREALSSFNNRVPDLLVTDIRMPGVTGLELLLATRKRDATVPVIIVTAFGDETVQREVSESSNVRYHEKPCDIRSAAR